MKYTFILDNLNCANCAGKIEKKIIATNGISDVSFNFSTKKLILKTENTDIKNQIQNICDSIEDGVNVIDKNENIENTSNKNNVKNKLIFIIISSVLTVISFILHLSIFEQTSFIFATTLILCLISTILVGTNIFIKGVKSVIKLHIDETTLMTVAVISAFCLGEFVEASIVTILFSLGELIESKAVNSSRKNIEKLANIRPDTATVINNNIEQTVEASTVEIGSIILVKPYDRIPIDGVIVEGSTTIDKSALTGESIPVEVNVNSQVLSGSLNGSNSIKIKTTKEFGDSTATRIIKLVEEASAQKGKSEKLISKFASIYTPIIILISVAVAVIPPLCGLGSFSQWIYRALVCMVASCPCAIVISVPLAYYSGIGASSKIGLLIKGGKYLEALSKADTFVFDKTGTLTTGKLSVDCVKSYCNMSEEEILCLASACEKYSSHPIAVAIKNTSTNKFSYNLSNYKETAGYGTSATLNEDTIKCGGKNILSKEDANKELDASVFLLINNTLVGAITVNDTVRKESKDVIKSLNNYGIKTVMLTGDNEKTAQKIASQLNIKNVCSQLLPEQKLIKMNELKNSSSSICFVGDGINDAPVLSNSDCGIALGMGSEIAIESADAVLSSNNLTPLPTAIKIAKRVMNTVKTNITFALVVKLLVIILATFGIANMWMSVVADTGVSVLCVLYATRILKL